MEWGKGVAPPPSLASGGQLQGKKYAVLVRKRTLSQITADLEGII